MSTKVLQALRTTKPQRDHLHLISRTKNSHFPLYRAPRTHKPKWVNPKDRIKWWNITPGDRVRMISGRADYKAKHRLEVLEVDREKNWIYLKDGPQLMVHYPNPTNEPDAPKFSPVPMPVHYSNVQIYIGDFEFPPLEGQTEPRVLPVYATRVQRSPPYYSPLARRFKWTRYAAATTPSLPEKHDADGNPVRIEIPWPEHKPMEMPDPGPLDTTADEALKLTWVPPPPTLNPGYHKKGTPPPQDVYLNPAAPPDPSAPMEHFVTRELASYFSRANRTKRWQQRGAYRAARLARWVRREKRESEEYADGRSGREIRMEATWKFERAEEARLKARRKGRWVASDQGRKVARKSRRRSARKSKRREKLNRVAFRPAKNQYIPPGLNVVDEVKWVRPKPKTRGRAKY